MCSRLGLFSGLFAHKFGARATGVVGSLVLAASLGVSFLATSVPFLVVTLGIFAGKKLTNINYILKQQIYFKTNWV